MATPKPVSKRLREMLGTEAAETMVEWLNGLETHQDALRREVHADIAALRQDMVALITELRAEMRAGFAAVDARFAAVDTKLAEADAKNAQRCANLLKWMIGFWLGSLAGIIATVLALGRASK